MSVAELYFGRDIPGRAPLTEAEWSGFVAHVIARAFPDGFTVQDGDGAWTDPASKRLVQEKTKILTIALPADSRRSAGKLEAVIAAYRTQFHQVSVGLFTHTLCGQF